MNLKVVARVVSAVLALVGFSMGGYVALEIFRRAPDRISRLALVDTSARADDDARRQVRREQIALAEAGRYPSLVKMAIPSVIHPSRVDDANLVSLLETMALRIGAEAFVRQQLTCMSRPSSVDALKGITCPVLVVCGKEDTLTPPQLSYEMGAAMNAPVVLVDDCNHYTPMEQPQALSALLRWWLQMKSP